MTRFHLTFLAIAVLFLSSATNACDLSLTIVPHSDRVVFGDPLYIKVTLTNRTDKPVAGPRPDLIFGSLSFTVSDAYGPLSYTAMSGGGLMGGLEMLVFEPGKPVTYYFTLMLPKYRLFDHLFWKRYRDGAIVTVQGMYNPFYKKVLTAELPKDIPLASPSGRRIVSARQKVHLDPRPDWQIEGLRAWAEREIDPKDYKRGPFPADFHLPVHVANREEMGRFAFATVLDGELGGLAALSLKFRDIYDLPPESREPADRDLIEWLRKEPGWERVGEFYMIPGPGGGLERVRLRPDVKRQALAHMLRGNAGSYNMRSTAETMEKLIEEPALAGSETAPKDGVD